MEVVGYGHQRYFHVGVGKKSKRKRPRRKPRLSPRGIEEIRASSRLSLGAKPIEGKKPVFHFHAVAGKRIVGLFLE